MRAFLHGDKAVPKMRKRDYDFLMLVSDGLYITTHIVCVLFPTEHIAF